MIERIEREKKKKKIKIFFTMQLRLQPQRSNTIDRIHRSKNPLRTPDEILKLNDYLTNSRLHPIYQTEYPVEI